MKKRLSYLGCALAFGGLVTACGDDTATATNLSGQVVKGPVNGADVCAYAISGGVKASSPLVACVKTDANGNYTMPAITAYSGDIIVEASGGTYLDEATNTTKSLGTTTPMKAVLAAGGNLTGVITPLTTVAVSASTSLSSSAFNTAASAVAAQAGLGTTNLLTTLPTFVAGSRTATNAYAAALGAFAQYMQTNSASLQQALAAWTPANQAAFQTALSTYASLAGVGATALPVAFNFSATGNTVVAGTTNGTGSTTVTGTTPAGTVTGSGGTTTSSSLTVTGGGAAFSPLVGQGLAVAGVTTITFTGLSGVGSQSLTVVSDNSGITVSYSESAALLVPGKQWSFTCKPSACAGVASINLSGKSLTLSNVVLTAESGGATGTITVNGSGSYL